MELESKQKYIDNIKTYIFGFKNINSEAIYFAIKQYDYITYLENIKFLCWIYAPTT